MTTKAAVSVAALALLILAAGCTARSPKATADVAAESKPETDTKTHTLPGLDHGLSQSPINILSSQAEGGHHEIALHYDHGDPDFLENKGHTIELDFPQGSSITFDGAEYALKQLHFHTPSEHQIDGVTFPMEMHVVNMIEPKTEDDPPRYLVIGYLFKMGGEDPFIASFLDEVPGKEGVEELESGKIFMDNPNQREEYYHYRGSLTTPPYTETVEWLIVQEIQQASPEQIRRIHLLEGDNARRVQARYGRRVED